MISLDTNVLARYLLNDEPIQAKAAMVLLSRPDVYSVPASVVLELVWVLEANDCDRSEVLRGLRHLLGLPNLQVRELESIGYAIRWYESGMDFADALHLALSSKDERFVTFDRALARRAEKIGAFPTIELVGR
jgi:predicted nucleic-acid-binding protein